MSLSKANDKLKYDSRMLEFNLNHGLITPEEIKKNLQSLPDSSALVLIEDKSNSEVGNSKLPIQ